MRMKITGIVLALIGMLGMVSCVVPSTATGSFVGVTRAELDAALAATLAQSREVDFPEKIRFEALRFTHTGALGVEGRARLFDPASGQFAPPDIRFFGSVPLGWWRVEQGGLVLTLVSVDGIAPVPGGAGASSDAAERIRDTLGTGLGTLMRRMSFPTGLDPARSWRIGSVQSGPEGIQFELRPR